MTRFILFVVASSLTVLLICSYLLVEPYSEPIEQAVAPNYEPIPELYDSGDTLNMHLHYASLMRHFDKPFFQNLSTGLAYRQDDAIENFYKLNYTYSENSTIADIGYLAIAIINSRNERMEFCQKALEKIKNQNMPYYKQEKAYLEYKTGNPALAEEMLLKAIKETPTAFAQKGLVRIHYNNRNYAALKAFLNDSTLQCFPNSILAEVYFYSGNLVKYYTIQLRVFKGAWIQAFAALAVAFVWFSFLSKLDLFSKLSSRISLVTFVISLFTTLLCWIPYEVFSIFFDFNSNQHIPNDFLYCIFGIGLIEESIKLLPIVIVFYIFRKKITEPYHYLMIASVAALGFSCLENCMYFKNYPGQIIYLRAMVSVTVHLFCTTLIIYGAKVISYDKKKFDLKFGSLYFLAAIGFHGLFDLFLINQSLHILSLFSYGLMIASIYGLNSMYNYALNLSPTFIDNVRYEPIKIRKLLMGGFTAILLMEFVLGSFSQGYNASYDLLIGSLGGFLIFVSYLSFGLSDLILVYKFRKGIFSYTKPFSYKKILYETLLLKPTPKNTFSFEPVNLVSTNRVKVKEEINYILAYTDESTPFQGYTNLLLLPYLYADNKTKNYYHGKVYGIESELDTFYTETPTLKLLGTAEITIPGKDGSVKPSFFDRLNVVGYFFLGLLLVGLFVYYMEYNAARIAYRWAFPFLEEKTLSTAGDNIDYALHKDKEYAEAHLLAAKIAMNVDDYETAFKHCIAAKVSTEKEKADKDFLLGKYYYHKKLFIQYIPNSTYNRSAEAMHYFEKIAKQSYLIDSANYYMAKLLQREQNNEAAYTLLTKTFPTTRNDSINFFKINYLIEKEKYEEADQILRHQFNKTGTNLPYYHFWKGKVALGKGDSSDACLYLNKAHALNYGPAIVYYGIHCLNMAEENPKTDSLASVVQP